MSKKKKMGGARPGAGAPKSKDPKIQFSISFRKSTIEKNGGQAKFKETICKMFEPN